MGVKNLVMLEFGVFFSIVPVKNSPASQAKRVRFLKVKVTKIYIVAGIAGKSALDAGSIV